MSCDSRVSQKMALQGVLVSGAQLTSATPVCVGFVRDIPRGFVKTSECTVSHLELEKMQVFCFVLFCIFFKLLIGCSLRWAHVLVYTEGLERNSLRIWRKTINDALTRKPKGMT